MRDRRAITVLGRAAAGVAAAAVLASCVGSVTRADFEDEMRARGGGLSQDLVLDAVVAVAEAQGSDPVQLRSLAVTPGRVSMEVRVPGSTEDLDAYAYGSSGLYGGSGLDGPEPVARSSTERPLESSVFTASAAGVRHFDAMVDTALAEADLPGGYATAATIDRPEGSPEPRTAVTVTNERRTVTVAFTADGSVVEVVR